MKGARMVILSPTTKVPERCFVCGRNFKKEMVLDVVVIDKAYISFMLGELGASQAGID